MRRKDQQRIEPTPRLVDTLRNKITRKRALEQLLVLEGVMTLRIWHAARLEPAIEDLFDTSEVPFALFRGDGDVIDFFPVYIGDALDT